VVAREHDLFVFSRTVDGDSGVVASVDATVADHPAKVMGQFRIPLGRQFERLPAALKAGHHQRLGRQMQICHRARRVLDGAHDPILIRQLTGVHPATVGGPDPVIGRAAQP